MNYNKAAAKSMPELPREKAELPREKAVSPLSEYKERQAPRAPDMSPNSRNTLELTQKKRREKDNEWHLIAQIKALNKQLDNERLRRVEEEAVIQAEQPKTRLIVVANRLPVTPRRARDTGQWQFERSSGGLVSAFLGVHDMDIEWVGWVGCPVPEEEQAYVTELLSTMEPFPCHPVYIDAETADHFYNGFCNNVLWPLLHYIPLSMLDSQASVAELQWQAYQDCNRLFCNAVTNLQLTENDFVWVQDYHLMLVPRYLREASPQMSIGWFLHTPFATSEMYRTLPHREEILRGVLGADLVGFHIYDYARHFHTACSRVLGTGGVDGITEGNEGIFDHASRRSIAVDAFPIGIEPSRFESCLDTPLVKDRIIELQRRFDGKKVLLGIDRLDYVKGIPHKLKAIESFLRQHPSWAGKVVLLQIAIPSRTEVPGYQKLRNNVHKHVGRINGEFGTLDNVPIHYLDQSMSFHELCALYFRADVMFVTSLRDGMNLVSFEYIACQKVRKGVLLLSEFAGAAQALGAGALLINPYNTDEVASALHDALNMTRDEREARFDYMSSHIKQHTSQHWAEKFVGSLRHARSDASIFDAGPFSGLEESKELPQREVVGSYRACERMGGKRLLIFGLLGTLIDYPRFVSMEHVLPSVRRNLAEIAASPLNTVIVCSGRERALMNEWLGDLPIWMVAENGLFFRPPPASSLTGIPPPSDVADEWEMLKASGAAVKDELDDSWMASLKPVFKYFEARTPESFTEVQEFTMTWHFPEDDFAEVQAGDLQAHLVKVSGHAPVEVSLDMRRVEVRPYGVSKGAAIATILDRIAGKERGETPLSISDDLDADGGSLSPLLEARRALEMGYSSPRGSRPPSNPGSPPQHHHHAGTPASAASSNDSSNASDPYAKTSGLGLGSDEGGSSSNLRDSNRPRESGNGVNTDRADDRSANLLSQFRWVFCASEVMSRDEDLFATLLQEGADEDSSSTDHGNPRVFTCCVSKTLSQAEYHIADLNEVTGLLDLLAHVSLDAAPSLSKLNEFESTQQTPQALELPSTLERLNQLVKLLAGKQLMLIFDYEGAPALIADGGLTKDAKRVLQRYPTALVQREKAQPTNDVTTDLSWGSSSFSSSKDLFSSPQAAGHGASEPSQQIGSISGVEIVSFGAVGNGEGSHVTVVEQVNDSYRPALEVCLEKLTKVLGAIECVAIEDNTFSLTLTHRGAEDAEAEKVRELASALVSDEFPMLRVAEDRTEIVVRPEAGWNRARMVEWVVSQLVESVETKLGQSGVVPVYLGTDPAFRHVSAIGGLDILITGGQSIDSFFLRSAMQVDELLGWFADQHAAGVTVRGGKLRPPRAAAQPPLTGMHNAPKPGKRVQIAGHETVEAGRTRTVPSSNSTTTSTLAANPVAVTANGKVVESKATSKENTLRHAFSKRGDEGGAASARMGH